MNHAISSNQRRIGRMSWTEYRDHIARSPVVFLPAGALEQHGPHLPMGCDAIFAEAIALEAAATLDALVMPPLTYGYKSQERSGGGQTFPGTTSLDGQTLTAIVRDIIRELHRHNVRHVVVLNGHVENQWFLTEGIDLALRDCAAAGNTPPQVTRCEYWNYTPQHVLESLFEGAFPGVDLEHAALLETSMMLALHPEWVKLDAFPENLTGSFSGHDSYPQKGRGVPPSGVLAPVKGASAEKGRLLIETTAARLAEALRKEFASVT